MGDDGGAGWRREVESVGAGDGIAISRRLNKDLAGVFGAKRRLREGCWVNEPWHCEHLVSEAEPG